jgi:hypothetical protein
VEEILDGVAALKNGLLRRSVSSRRQVSSSG